MMERLIKIHRQLEAKTYLNTKQLSKLCECGISTISKDIEFLKDRLLAPIEYDSKKNGYYYTEKYKMVLNPPSAKDLSMLAIAKSLLTQYKDTPIYDDLCNAFQKFTTNQCITTTDFINRIAIPPAPEIVIAKTTWDLIYKAMQENKILEFKFEGRWNTNETDRRVCPYQLLVDGGKCFLFGYCETRKAERLFYLPRIKNIEITEETFSLPKNYDFSSRCSGGKFGAFIESRTVKYKMRFFKDSRQYIKDCIWAEDQKITDYDDYSEMEFSSSQTYKVLEWILAQGPNAQPIEPKEFVAEWKKQISLMMELTKGLL